MNRMIPAGLDGKNIGQSLPAVSLAGSEGQGKDERRPSEIENKKAFHGVKTSNVSPSRRLLRAGGQHRMLNGKR